MTRQRPSSSRPRVRLLTPEETVLWVEVTKSVIARPEARLPDVNAREGKAQSASLEAILRGSPEIATPLPKPAPRPLPLAPLERRLKQRLSRGRLDVDASVDLHGLRQDEAHAQLRRFLFGSQKAGARIVLVVTGKGRSASASATWSERGILRRSVPLWLAEADLRHIVLGYEEASPMHGGSGALYVRLRSGARRGEMS